MTEPDLYGDPGPEGAYSEYTVYVDCGDAETRFKAFIETLGSAVETSWKDWHWA